MNPATGGSLTSPVGAGNEVRADTDAPWYTRLPGPLAFLPAALGIAVVFFASTAYLQATHPFLAPDDWDTILPADPDRSKLLFNRPLAEGRWLNYVWWRVGSFHLTPVSASLLYFAAYAAFILRLAQRLAPGWLGLLVGGALFVSPMVAEAASWPAILGPSMVVLAVAIWTLPLCRHRTSLLLVWVAASTLLAMLTYQPAALLVFLILILEELHRSIRQLAALAVTFCLVWAGSVLVIFALNWLAYGTFGIQVQQWRKPNPVHDAADVLHNLAAAGRHLSMVADALPVPLVVGSAALVACLVVKQLRKSGIVLLLTVVVMGALESVTTIQGGYLTPFRSSTWVWIVIVVAVLWLKDLPVPGARIIAGVSLGVVAAFGSLYWINSVADRQQRLEVYDKISWRVSRLIEETGASKVAIIGSEVDWKYYVFAQQATYLRSRTIFEHDVEVRSCRPSSCQLARDREVIDRTANVSLRGDYVVIRPPVSEWSS